MSTAQTGTNTGNPFEASFSTLVLSLASHAAMALGLEPHPSTGESQIELPMARFNIDLLIMLKDKTKSNLTTDEQKFLDAILGDLQMQFVHVSQRGQK
jgi:hypothetical protein